MERYRLGIKGILFNKQDISKDPPDDDFATHADYRELEEELAALRVRVGELVDASTSARRELNSCQAVIHLYGGFDLACVQGAQKAISKLSDALEALK